MCYNNNLLKKQGGNRLHGMLKKFIIVWAKINIIEVNMIVYKIYYFSHTNILPKQNMTESWQNQKNKEELRQDLKKTKKDSFK